MQVITTTQLRTKSKELVKALQEGCSVDLIHRSKVIGILKPAQEPKPLTKEDIDSLKKLAQKLNLPKLSYKERGRRYGKYLMGKYGKSLS
ncbi:hypothetical protein HYW41_04780 [Candidatus Daviesbacteria bacterium]|nr:hypothetical protein [Candidatus Daviesbacteria bacterium]